MVAFELLLRRNNAREKRFQSFHNKNSLFTDIFLSFYPRNFATVEWKTIQTSNGVEVLETPLIEGLATKKIQLVLPEKGWKNNAEVTCVYRSAFYSGTIHSYYGEKLKFWNTFLWDWDKMNSWRQIPTVSRQFQTKAFPKRRPATASHIFVKVTPDSSSSSTKMPWLKINKWSTMLNMMKTLARNLLSWIQLIFRWGNLKKSNINESV